MIGVIIMNKYEAMNNTLNFMDSPEYAEFLKDLNKRREEYEIIQDNQLKKLYDYICTFENFEDYLEDLDKRRAEILDSQTDDYTQTINEEYDLVEVAFKYGTKINENLLNEMENINSFISDYSIFKGYYFGIMYGQGSLPWWMPVEDVYNKLKVITQNSQLSLL